MTFDHVVDGKNSLQMDVNMLNKEFWTVDKGCSSGSGWTIIISVHETCMP